MANTSIRAAFERFWQHTVALVGNSSDNALASAKAYTDSKLGAGGSMGGGFVAQSTAPSNTNVLWIDTSADGGLKYYNGSSWVSVPVRFS